MATAQEYYIWVPLRGSHLSCHFFGISPWTSCWKKLFSGDFIRKNRKLHRSTKLTQLFVLKQNHLFPYSFGSLSPSPESPFFFFPSRQNFAVLPISWLPGQKISFWSFSEKLWEISKIWPDIGDFKLNSAHFKKKKLKIGSAVLEILAI